LDAGEVAGIGELVEHRDLVVGVGEHPAHVVRPDEPGRAGDEQLHDSTSARVGALRSLSETIIGSAQSTPSAGSSGHTALPAIPGRHSLSKQYRYSTSA